METSEASASALIPSQALSPPNESNSSNAGDRRRGRRKKNKNKNEPPAQGENGAGRRDVPNKGDGDTTEQNTSSNEPMASSGSKQKSRPRNRRQRSPKPSTDKNEEDDKKVSAKAQQEKKPKPTRGRPKRAKGKKKYPWRRHIPPGSVDPISLDPLVSLTYPPFALVAAEPYVPVPKWPVNETDQEEQAGAPLEYKDNAEVERKKRLEEQWGKNRLTTSAAADIVADKAAPNETAVAENSSSRNQKQRRHYHLYDGRALAYYLVSQLQFIDPLNRRDLTRNELVNLDAYLLRHGFRDLKVIDAYDAKGVTVSVAGTAGQTAAGRAQILQQEAQVLLNALFSGHAPPPTPPTTSSTGAGVVADVTSNPLRQQYAAHQQTSTRQTYNNRRTETEDAGIYSPEYGGMIVIDDDANPGLRGGGFRSATTSAVATTTDSTVPAPNTLWSASHITGNYSHSANVHARNFPSLPSASAEDSTSAPAVGKPKEQEVADKPPSRSLQRITKVVKKTDPAEIQRQREAREEAQRRAMLANLAFVPPGTQASTPSSTSVAFPGQAALGAQPPPAGPSEGQLERNRALASALGVTPSTVRQNYNSGWARPTEAKIELDEFGNELNAAQYPDSLIMAARERMEQLLKLERRWKTFLADDTAASLPLQRMDRDLRAFVHQYSDFWCLHTESFDPEPKRYIHCVKLRDTSIPHPLLSEAVRNWRGPGQLPPQQLKVPSSREAAFPEVEHASRQTAGQSTLSREFPPPPHRVPLKLLPRSAGASDEEYDTADARGTTLKPDTQTEAQLNSRFDSLFTGRERPKLDLAPRTKPAELPPFQPVKGYDVAAERERFQQIRDEKARKEREAAEKKKKILEAAFASSDEESAESSEWEEEEQLYSGGESEEE